MKLIHGSGVELSARNQGKILVKTLHTTFLFLPSINLYNRVSRHR